MTLQTGNLEVGLTFRVIEDPVSDDDALDRLISWFLGQEREYNDSEQAVYWTSDSSDRDTESDHERDEDQGTEHTEPCLHGVEEPVNFTPAQEEQSGSSTPRVDFTTIDLSAGDDVLDGVGGEILKAQEEDEEGTEEETLDSAYPETITTLDREIRRGGWADDDDEFEL